jgi:uncharacterized protein (TIGR00251 family)
MLRYTAEVVPKAAKNEVIKHSDNRLKVKVTAPANEGKANQAVISELARFFGVSKSRVIILSGEKRKRKIVGVLDD